MYFEEPTIERVEFFVLEIRTKKKIRIVETTDLSWSFPGDLYTGGNVLVFGATIFYKEG